MTDPATIQPFLLTVLDTLVDWKAMWLIRWIRTRPAYCNNWWEEVAQGAIAQIHRLVPEIWMALSPQWRCFSPAKHGRYFRVYQALNPQLSLTSQLWSKRSWDQVFREVALLKLGKRTRLMGAFPLLQRGDWQTHPGIVWKTEQYPLRNATAGDILVSLASGAGWMITEAGVLPLTAPGWQCQQGLRACELLTRSVQSEPQTDLLFQRAETFFTRLGWTPVWIGKGQFRRCVLSETQQAVLGLLDPSEVPDLDVCVEDARRKEMRDAWHSPF